MFFTRDAEIKSMNTKLMRQKPRRSNFEGIVGQTRKSLQSGFTGKRGKVMLRCKHRNVLLNVQGVVIMYYPALMEL